MIPDMDKELGKRGAPVSPTSWLLKVPHVGSVIG